jgi:hypothetical protein
MDSDTVISDITDNNTVISDELKQDDIRAKTDANLNNLTNDALKDKCKEHGIKNAFKMKKPELVQALLIEFMKLVSELKEKKVNELKALCKQYNIKYGASVKKDDLYWLVLNYCSDNLKMKLDTIEVKEPEQLKEPGPSVLNEPKSLLEHINCFFFI